MAQEAEKRDHFLSNQMFLNENIQLYLITLKVQYSLFMELASKSINYFRYVTSHDCQPQSFFIVCMLDRVNQVTCINHICRNIIQVYFADTSSFSKFSSKQDTSRKHNQLLAKYACNLITTHLQVQHLFTPLYTDEQHSQIQFYKNSKCRVSCARL